MISTLQFDQVKTNYRADMNLCESSDDEDSPKLYTVKSKSKKKRSKKGSEVRTHFGNHQNLVLFRSPALLPSVQILCFKGRHGWGGRPLCGAAPHNENYAGCKNEKHRSYIAVLGAFARPSNNVDLKAVFIHLIYLKIISLMGPVKNDLCSKLRRRKSWGRRRRRRASQTARPSSGTWWPWWRPRWGGWTNILRTLNVEHLQNNALFLYQYLLFCHQAVQYPKDK